MHPDPICECSHQYGQYCASNDGHYQYARAFAGQWAEAGNPQSENVGKHH